jgi:AraC family transcriptional regulator of arabinose operon
MEIIRYYSAYDVYAELEDLWLSEYHKHGDQHYELHYFISGVGEFLYGDTRYAINNGFLMICKPNVFHQIRATNPSNPVSYFAVLMSLEENEELSLLFKKNPNIVFKPYRLSRDYRLLFEEIRERIISERDADLQIVKHRIISFFYELSLDQESVTTTPFYFNDLVRKADAYLRNNISHKLSVSDVARYVQTSEEHLIRTFKKVTGRTLYKHYTEIRLKVAEEMLRNSDYTIAEISKRCGYSNPYVFSKAFRRENGIPPRELRNKLRYSGDKKSIIQSDATRIVLKEE